FNCGFVLNGSWNKTLNDNKNQQFISVSDGAVFEGTNDEKAFFKSTLTDNNIDWNFGDALFKSSDNNTAHFHLENGAHRFKAQNTHFINGKYAVKNINFAAGKYFLLRGIVEENVNRKELPAESNAVKHRDGNMIL